MATRKQVERTLTRALNRWPDSNIAITSATQTYSPTTDSATRATPSKITGLRLEYTDSQINGTSVMSGDYKLMAHVSQFASKPISGNEFTVSGECVNVIRVTSDPTGASYTIQVRPL